MKSRAAITMASIPVPRQPEALKVHLLTPKERSRSIPLKEGMRLRLGRGDCEICIPSDHTLSRVHGEIELRNGLRFRDLRSLNGSLVNGVLRSGWVSLKLGDRIEVGQSWLIVVRDSPPEVRRGRRCPSSRIEERRERGPGGETLDPDTARVAQSDISLLLVGETGVGKSRMAALIHQNSSRKNEPFVEVNCSALPANLIESELFGYNKGAFTDARSDRAGLLETAQAGTVFLDEIGDLPLSLQSKLLHVLEAKTFMRVGGREALPVRTRFIAATNQDIREKAKSQAFRMDLYYRLAGYVIELRPLRERRHEIPAIANRLMRSIASELERTFHPLSGDVLEMLLEHDWPGNVRELKNVLRRSLLLADAPLSCLNLRMDGPGPLEGPTKRYVAYSRTDDLRSHVAAAEKRRILDALREHNHIQTKAAEALGISRRTLASKMAEFGISGRGRGRVAKTKTGSPAATK